MTTRYEIEFDDPRDEGLASALSLPTRKLTVQWSVRRDVVSIEQITRDTGEVCTNDDTRRGCAFDAIDAYRARTASVPREPEIEDDTARLTRIDAQMLQHGGVDSEDKEWLVEMAWKVLDQQRARRELISEAVREGKEARASESAVVARMRRYAMERRPHVSEAEIEAGTPAVCCGCGTNASLAEVKRVAPKALSCCPERKMVRPA